MNFYMEGEEPIIETPEETSVETPVETPVEEETNGEEVV